MPPGTIRMTLHGTSVVLIPVTEANVLYAAHRVWRTLPPRSDFKIGTEARIHAVSRHALEASTGFDDNNLLAHEFVVKYGDFVTGRKEIFIARKPSLPWEDLRKLHIVMPDDGE